MGKRGKAVAAGELTTTQVNAFALVMWPLCVGQMPLTFMVAYYAQTQGIALSVLGFILLLGRVFDVICDLSVAAASDSLPTRWGRRKPWIVVGLPLFVISCWLLFVPHPTMTLPRYAIAMFLFFLTWTMAFIPYLSQGTELSTDPVQRSRANIAQSFVMLTGFIVGMLLPYLAADKRTFPMREALGGMVANLHLPAFDGLVRLLHTAPLEGVESFGRNMLVIVIATSVVTPIALIGYLLFVPGKSPTARPIKGSLVDAFRNTLFLRFCGGYELLMAGNYGRQGLLPFILAFCYQRADLLLTLMIVQYAVSIAVTPVWGKLFLKLERKTCIALAACVDACAVLMLALAPSGADGVLIASFAIAGLCGQTLYMAPYLVAAESADYAKWRFRSESRAVHVSLVSLIVKSGSIWGALSIWAVGLAGFDPKITVQPTEMLHLLKIVGLWLPMLFLLGGAALIFTYPMTRRRQAAVQRRLERREAAEIMLEAEALTASGPR